MTYVRSIKARQMGDTTGNGLHEPLTYRYGGRNLDPNMPKPPPATHPLDYPCTLCMALPGRPCRTHDGPIGTFHPPREKAAR